jgi:outer membrane protein OmpA-like peptidoglycan-associated protein
MAFTGKDSHYLAGKLQTANAEAYIAVMVGKQRTQVDIVENKAMDTGMVAVNAEALAAGLARDGKVSIYGIYFDTGKAAVKPESKPTLDEIAKLLQQQPALKIFVVGHTDNAGTLVLNLQLAKDRAASVVQALVADYQIAAARLDPHGVGPLAPAATNATEDGRAKNRRVELVAQ